MFHVLLIGQNGACTQVIPASFWKRAISPSSSSIDIGRAFSGIRMTKPVMLRLIDMMKRLSGFCRAKIRSSSLRVDSEHRLAGDVRDPDLGHLVSTY